MDEARREALGLAIQESRGTHPPDHIVAAAQTFYEFLVGAAQKEHLLSEKAAESVRAVGRVD